MKQLPILLMCIAITNLIGNEQEESLVKKGKAVYAANCAICHTVNGGSALGPDFNMVAYTRTKEEIESYAKDPYANYKKFGHSANAMPTLPLEDIEFKEVAAYISSLQPFKKWMIRK